MAYASVAERMLAAIGEPELVDTRLDPRLSRIFANKMLKLYPAFRDFYGMEEAIEHIVSYFRHAARAWKRRSRSSTCSGRWAAASRRWPKNSIPDRKMPFYAIKGSPVHESPLGLFKPRRRRPHSRRRLRHPAPLPRHHHESRGRSSACTSSAATSPLPRRQALPFGAVADCRGQDRAGRREQPGHLLAGRQDRHPQARNLLAGRPGRLFLLRRPVPGQPRVLEFVEMFKAPIKVLHPLLTATQEGNYKGTEGFGAIPFDGMVLAHSNEAEWCLQEQPQQRGLPRPHLHRQGALLPARVRRRSTSTKSCCQLLAVEGAVRTRHPAHDGAVFGALAPQGTRELQHLLQDAGL
jgi:serine protein kinase